MTIAIVILHLYYHNSHILSSNKIKKKENKEWKVEYFYHFNDNTINDNRSIEN